MKSLKYILFAIACLTFTACMDGDDSLFNEDWKDPDLTEAPFGNNNITEDGVITIAQLKEHPNYRTVFNNSTSKLVEDDIKLKVRVTGNDIGGNLYKQFAVQDATGAMIVAVNQSGLCGYLPEGQQIIIDLKGLYVGGYGMQPQIGAPYNGQIGRMSKDIWDSHFKIIGDIDASEIQPVEFTSIEKNVNEHCGKLVKLSNVTFRSANGKNTLVDGASSGGNYFNQGIDGYTSNELVIRTSSYADFAATVLPYDEVNGKKITCDIIGIATQYRGTWQIMMRKTSDLQIHSSY